MSRRKKEPEHVNHERWLVSYADLVTLLFALFVVLFGTSQVDQRKLGKLALSVQVAFQELGLFDAAQHEVPIDPNAPVPFNTAQAIDSNARNQDFSRVVPEAQEMLVPVHHSSPGELRSGLEKQLSPQLQRGEVKLEQTERGLIITLREIGFFESGAAEIRADKREVLGGVAEALKPWPYLLRIEGHTDNVPIHTDRFPSNWELSTARATHVTRMLIEQFGLSPERLGAAGYGEHHPAMANDTPEGRSANRRVDIVVEGYDPTHELTPLRSPVP